MDSLNVQFIEEYWYGFIIFIFSIYFLIKFFPDFRAYVISKTPLKSALSQIFVWTLVILTFTSNRYNVFNGFLKPSEAVVDGIENPHQVALAINTPYNFLWDYKQPVENPTLAIHYPEPKRTVDSSSTNKNVLLIVLESFASEATQKLNPYTEKSYTPFLDSLFQKGFLFENAFSNGRQSMDAIPAIWNSIPALEVPFILASKKFEKISGLPSVMKANGYHTSYFHAAQNGSMDFDRYAKQNSIDAYYGMKEYPTPKKDFDGTWGIWDEPYLQFVAKELETLNKPFFSTVFTLSSHNPCKIPNKYESSFEGGELAIYKAIEYSDMALRKFFETAKKQSWYQNTLFVIVADHSIHPLRKEFKTAERGFSIPIFFYEPGNESLKGNSKRLAQQLDIFPTILGELGIPKPKNILGNDLFDSQSKEMVINYYNGVYQIQNNNTTRYYTVQSIDGKESTKIPFDQEVSKILGMNLKPIMN
jgi:phosphoglycerol transferase MdoB-like AlkP superfamily enzyme